MATEISVPDIGDFESVEIIEILVKPGDIINKNDPVVTLESDKSSVEVPSPFAGKISALKVKIGDKVSKGSVLALIDEEETKVEQQSSEQEKEKTKPIALKEDKINLEILKDTSYFRVLDLTSTTTKTSYFHNSITGYHAAKLSSYNEILEFYINKTHLNILNMLNTKYVIFNNEDGTSQLYVNDFANGPAWFIDSIINVDSKDKEIIALDSLSNKTKAISTEIESKKFIIDDDSYVKLLEFNSNKITYEYNTKDDGFIVFSEVFYPNGWHSYIDGEKTQHFNVNYILRGMNVKSGSHIIEFVFDPDVVKKGSMISLSASLLLFIIIIGMLYKFFIKELEIEN